MDLKIEQGKALKHAYAFARSGNFTWAQLWVNRASDFMSVTPRQLAYVQKLFDSHVPTSEKKVQGG
jgi:hypothetical protein